MPDTLPVLKTVAMPPQLFFVTQLCAIINMAVWSLGMVYEFIFGVPILTSLIGFFSFTVL